MLVYFEADGWGLPEDDIIVWDGQVLASHRGPTTGLPYSRAIWQSGGADQCRYTSKRALRLQARRIRHSRVSTMVDRPGKKVSEIDQEPGC